MESNVIVREKYLTKFEKNVPPINFEHRKKWKPKLQVSRAISRTLESVRDQSSQYCLCFAGLHSWLTIGYVSKDRTHKISRRRNEERTIKIEREICTTVNSSISLIILHSLIVLSSAVVSVKFYYILISSARFIHTVLETCFGISLGPELSHRSNLTTLVNKSEFDIELSA